MIPSVPRTAVLELTFRCNHRCVFCSVPWDNPDGRYERQPELSASDWITCIDTLVGHGVTGFALSGGEPFLKEGFDDIVRHLRRVRVRKPVFGPSGTLLGQEEAPPYVTLITNGGLVTPERVESVRELLGAVVVSLPGLDTYAEHTGGGDREKALAALRAFDVAGVPTVVGICVTQRNLPELFETIATGFLNGGRQLLLNRFLPGGRGTGRQDLCLDRSQLSQMLRTAETVCLEAGRYGSIGTELPRCLVEERYDRLTVGTRCAGGVDFFAIDPAGRVRPCNHSPVHLGVWHDLPAAISTPYWQRFQTKNFLPSSCRGCGHTLTCDAGCREAAHIASGSLDAPDPLLLQV
ncbi:MAG TPA: radical SAM protein [Candidatus Ozemobacteraceae bacterium]|nr:radical SAM protein [Candidatus Ozemobacteraceae bacterium]